ncbi:MAG: glycosyltransferase family 2 protein [Bacteroidota bacterium]
MRNPNPSLPLISVAIPTYNGGKRILHALASLQRQDYDNLEIIISDNSSTDDTQAIVEYQATQDPRIRYFRHERNLGASYNFDFGLKQARGKYFIWMSDDDQLTDGALRRYCDFLETHSDYSLVSGVIHYVEGDEIVSRESNIRLDQNSQIKRCLEYYARVKEGGMYHGMMRTHLAQRLDVAPTLGSDWHFVASMAFMGKMRILDFVGYSKSRGGISSSFHHYARTYGERPIWGYLPFVKIGLDAFRQVMKTQQVFGDLGFAQRFFLATGSCVLVWAHYYAWIVPRMGLGWILRRLRIKTPKQRSLEKGLQSHHSQQKARSA